MKSGNRKRMVMGVSLGLVLLLAGGSVLYAHFGPGGGHGLGSPEEHAARICERLTTELELDENQQRELQAMAQDFVKKAGDFHQLRANGRQEVLTILRADTLDRQGMESLVARHQEEITGLITEVGPRLMDFAEILTSEQRARLATLIEEHAKSHHFMHN